MTKTFLDVPLGHWAYDEIMEAANTLMLNEEPLLDGIPYQMLEDNGYNRIVEEHIAQKNQLAYTLFNKFNRNEENPLFIYVDGVRTPYRSHTVDATNTSTVTLYHYPPEGSVVTFMTPGVAWTSPTNGRPGLIGYWDGKVAYPNIRLSTGYLEFNLLPPHEYVKVLGRTLKKVPISLEESMNTDPIELGRKYIGYKDDRYIITHGGWLLLPFAYAGLYCDVGFRYRKENGQVVYEQTRVICHPGGDQYGRQRQVIFTNRFFPNAHVSREEVIIAIDRLRQYFVAKFTDSEPSSGLIDEEHIAYVGQKAFRLNGAYKPHVSELEVSKFNLSTGQFVKLPKTAYTEFDGHSVLLKEPCEEGDRIWFFTSKRVKRFVDSDRNVFYYMFEVDREYLLGDIMTPEFFTHLANLEHETVDGGIPMIVKFNTISTYYSLSPYIKLFADGNDAVVDRPEGIKGPTVEVYDPLATVTRMDLLMMLNRFKTWCFERFL